MQTLRNYGNSQCYTAHYDGHEVLSPSSCHYPANIVLPQVSPGTVSTSASLLIQGADEAQSLAAVESSSLNLYQILISRELLHNANIRGGHAKSLMRRRGFCVARLETFEVTSTVLGAKYGVIQVTGNKEHSLSLSNTITYDRTWDR
jgi:hypothetical protein